MIRQTNRCKVCKRVDQHPQHPSGEWFGPGMCMDCNNIAEEVVRWKEKAHKPSMTALVKEVNRLLAFWKELK